MPSRGDTVKCRPKVSSFHLNEARGASANGNIGGVCGWVQQAKRVVPPGGGIDIN